MGRPEFTSPAESPVEASIRRNDTFEEWNIQMVDAGQTTKVFEYLPSGQEYLHQLTATVDPYSDDVHFDVALFHNPDDGISEEVGNWFVQANHLPLTFAPEVVLQEDYQLMINVTNNSGGEIETRVSVHMRE